MLSDEERRQFQEEGEQSKLLKSSTLVLTMEQLLTIWRADGITEMHLDPFSYKVLIRHPGGRSWMTHNFGIKNPVEECFAVWLHVKLFMCFEEISTLKMSDGVNLNFVLGEES